MVHDRHAMEVPHQNLSATLTNSSHLPAIMRMQATYVNFLRVGPRGVRFAGCHLGDRHIWPPHQAAIQHDGFN
jgi:hypothetical protein